MKQRIGIYPGSFDPIHNGHVAFAMEALNVCNLDQVFFMPEPYPRGKDRVTNIEHRIELIATAITGLDGLLVLDPPSKRFNVKETLPLLDDQFKDADLTLLVGSDVVKTFPYNWQDLDTLLKDVSLAIGIRADDRADEITSIISNLADVYHLDIHYQLIHTPNTHVASSKIKQQNTTARHLHPNVSKYIRKNNLYSKD